MTVKQLIKKLKKMPQDAKVFTYAESDDDEVVWVKKVTRDNLEDDSHQDQYYCQGDSMAACYLSEHEDEDVCVTIGGRE